MPFVDRFGDGIDLGVSCKDDSNDIRIIFFYFCQKLGSAHFRHALVGDYQVDIIFFKDLQAFSAAAGRQKPIAFFAQQAL